MPAPPRRAHGARPVPTPSRRPRRITLQKARPSRSVAANATIVAAAFVVSRVLGLLREILIARQFGTSGDYDAYVAAFRIPDLLFLVVMSGAFGSAFIPVFAGFLSRGEQDRAWRLASAVLTYTVLTLLVVGQLVFLFAGPLMRDIVAPGLAPPQQDLAVNITRLLLLSPLLLGLGAAAQGMLQAQDAFTLPAVAPILYNLGIIAGALLLAPTMGVYGLAVGVIVGAAGHAGIQFVGLIRRGMHFSPTLSRRVQGLGEVARLMAPRLVGQAAFQINFIVMTNFASRLGESKVSAINYAYQVFMLPHGVLALSLSTVIFPMMARQYELNQLDDLKVTLRGALGPLIFLTFPASVGLFAFRTSIVQVLFQFGSFSDESTRLVAQALAYFSVGLVAFAVVEAVTRAFYAMHDTRTPVTVAIVTVIANIALSAYLAPRLGHGGLALSIALTTIVEMAILLTVLYRRIGGLGRGLLESTIKAAAATAIMAVVALRFAGPLAQVTDPSDGRSIAGMVMFVVTLGATGITYLVSAYYLRAPELFETLDRVRSRLRRA
ncbi:integral membrane protein MviN [Sphaerobacter thermophilus DSM 20745]|uniref:Probable lipid II flippase MurJ n=1 Tax=Sphaerobacter thermophilus (strain ATCC 49802 / DSM 20745 / KCCM 41009 / NCIMB 13125 / S 6022) TaxID=479434 RepID=D1C336_SPHTD|nr:integral membrane protein MviN [Sphaerobacter thermophilus DSM 20745]